MLDMYLYIIGLGGTYLIVAVSLWFVRGVHESEPGIMTTERIKAFVFAIGFLMIMADVFFGNITPFEIILMVVFAVVIGTVIFIYYGPPRRRGPPSNGQAGESLAVYAFFLTFAVIVVVYALQFLENVGKWLFSGLDHILHGG